MAGLMVKRRRSGRPAPARDESTVSPFVLAAGMLCFAADCWAADVAASDPVQGCAEGAVDAVAPAAIVDRP